MPEQLGADIGHRVCSAGVVEERCHGEGRHDDLSISRTRRRRHRWPREHRVLDARSGDERPEHHQCALRRRVARRHHRPMSKEPREVEVPVGDTSNPIPNALACYTGALRRSGESGATAHLGDGAVDIGDAIHLARQNITGQHPLACLAVQTSRQHHRQLRVLAVDLEAAAHPASCHLEVAAGAAIANAARENYITAPRDVLRIIGRLDREYVGQHVLDGLDVF